MLFARLVLLVQALVWGALGVLYWVRPYEMANLSGMLLMEPSAVSDARVFYGGHQFALALFLLFALRRASLVQPALILVVLLQSILTLSRLLIAWIEGGMEADGNLFGLLFRGAMAALGIAALWWLQRRPPRLSAPGERRASRGRLRRPVTFRLTATREVLQQLRDAAVERFLGQRRIVQLAAQHAFQKDPAVAVKDAQRQPGLGVFGQLGLGEDAILGDHRAHFQARLALQAEGVDHPQVAVFRLVAIALGLQGAAHGRIETLLEVDAVPLGAYRLDEESPVIRRCYARGEPYGARFIAAGIEQQAEQEQQDEAQAESAHGAFLPLFIFVPQA